MSSSTGKKVIVLKKKTNQTPQPNPVGSPSPHSLNEQQSQQDSPQQVQMISRPDKFKRLGGGRDIKTPKDYRVIIDPCYMVCGTYDEVCRFCETYQSSILVPHRYDPTQPIVEQPFDLKGYVCKAKVLRVIDGDTYDLSVQVSLKWLMDTYKATLSFQATDDHFMTLTLNCRLFGIDCAEKNTTQGQEIKAWVIDTFNRQGNMIWVQLLHPDRIGRTLVNVFLTEDLSQNLTNTILSSFSDQYAYEYYGATKHAIGDIIKKEE